MVAEDKTMSTARIRDRAGHPGRTVARRAASRRARRGLSLVEVLVVVVILILGMLAIGRLFPEGFASLNFSEHATAAARLMALREEEARKYSDNLPDAIVGIDPNTGAILNNLTQDTFLTSLRQLNIAGLPGTPPDDPRFSNVNVARRVFGEQCLIPAPQATPLDPNGQPVSMYRALFSPIYSDVAMAPAALGVMAHSGSAAERVVMQDPPQSDNFRGLARAGHFGYGVDYENGFLYYIGVDYGRIYRMEYSYRVDPDTRGQSYPDNAVYFPPAQSGQTFVTVAGELTEIYVHRFNMRTAQIDQVYHHDLQSGQTNALPGAGAITFPAGVVYQGYPATAVLETGSDFLYRRFTQLALADPFTADPFEFKVYDPILGLIGFNPQAATFVTTAQRGKGLTAKIDYDVDDWHILHYDDVVAPTPVDPDGTPDNGDEYYPVKLPTGAIKELGETEETINFIVGQPDTVNSLQYQGLVRYYPDTPSRTGTPGLAIIVVDLATGYQIDNRTLQKPGPVAPPGLDNSNGEMDYRAGVVKLWKYRNRNTGDGPIAWNPPFAYQGGGLADRPFEPAGRGVRIYYRTSNDFAVASFKPFTRYHRQPVRNNVANREYFFGHPATGTPEGGYLTFAHIDSENTIAVDYSYRRRVDPSDPSLDRIEIVNGELLKLQRATGGSPFLLARVKNADYDPASEDGNPNNGEDQGAPTTVDPNSPGTRFYSVVEGSVIIRGVRGASFQTRAVWLEGRRMRHRQRGTILTRAATR